MGFYTIFKIIFTVTCHKNKITSNLAGNKEFINTVIITHQILITDVYTMTHISLHSSFSTPVAAHLAGAGMGIVYNSELFITPEFNRVFGNWHDIPTHHPNKLFAQQKESSVDSTIIKQ